MVKDPDSSPRAFRRAGSQNHSLNRKQNRYSYITTSTIAGFGGEAADAASELKAQAKAKFHMYCFVLR
jgi:hypothetical protein